MPMLIVDPLEWPARFVVPGDSIHAYAWIARGMGMQLEEYVVWHPQRERLDEPFPLQAVVIAGSLASAYDREPWIRALSRHIQDWAERSVPMLGICFGHQLIAQALGGRVETNPFGWELGYHQISLTEAGQADWFYSGSPKSFPALQSHRDAVIAMPPGAVCLACSDQCAIQSFAIGERIRTVQFHPEFSVGTMRAILDFFAAPFLTDGIDLGPIQRTVAECPASRGLLSHFLQRWAGEEAG